MVSVQERVLKVLQVWSDWFLFSDAYVNGLRATFLRSGNSGVTLFHSISGEATELEKRTGSEDKGNIGRTNEDAALAMGKGAAMQELMSLPIAELERRCKHNGLSLVGGRETMVARLLSLEEAEKQRVYELDENLKYGHRESNSGSRREANVEPEAMGSVGWNDYRDNETGIKEKGMSLPISQTFSIPQPELKPFVRKEKNDPPVLPASKWARDDDDDDDGDDGLKWSKKSMGLSYSSSGSENDGDGPSRAYERNSATDLIVAVQPDGGMSDEQRLLFNYT